MRAAIGAVLLLPGVVAGSSAVRANFVQITVTAPSATPLRAIWRPYVAAVGGSGAQQRALQAMFHVPNPADSAKRWRDPDARDTVSVKTPTTFNVDMNGGPIVIEVTGGDSVFVAAELMQQRGTASSWGRAFVVSADGRTVSVERRP